MAGERISIPPDVAIPLKDCAGFDRGKLAFAAPAIVQTLLVVGAIGAVALVWTFDPTCINGRRIGPPRYPLTYYYPALSVLIAALMAVAALAYRSAVGRWHDIRDGAARARAELDCGYLEVFELDVGPQHRLCDDSKSNGAFVLMLPVDATRTALVMLPADAPSEVVDQLKSRLRITAMPVSKSVTSMEFSGHAVEPNFASGVVGSALPRYFIERDLKWTMFGVIVDLNYDRACALAAEPAAARYVPASVAAPGVMAEQR